MTGGGIMEKGYRCNHRQTKQTRKFNILVVLKPGLWPASTPWDSWECSYGKNPPTFLVRTNEVLYEYTLGAEFLPPIHGGSE